jgi:hypothetical protein
MTEQSGPAGEPGESVRTGVPAVDEILVAVEALDADDLGSHVAAFEQAHEQLRRALDAPADPA